MNDNTYEPVSPVVGWIETEASWSRAAVSAFTKPPAPANDILRPTPIIVLLEEGQRAIDVFHEASKLTTSEHPLVRGVIDQCLGFIHILKPRPQDNIEERLLVVTPPNSMFGSWTKNVVRIAVLPGVKSAATQVAQLNY